MGAKPVGLVRLDGATGPPCVHTALVAKNVFRAVEGLMRKKRDAETDKEQKERLKGAAQKRSDDAAADDDAIDAMVKRSIKQHGP